MGNEGVFESVVLVVCVFPAILGVVLFGVKKIFKFKNW